MYFLKTIAFILIGLVYIQTVSCLECYVCTNQEGNVDKCLNTIKTCEQEEDVCVSEIKWGSTPYWSQGAIKQYYVSKRCATKDKCERMRDFNMPLCTHIWYEDWKCSECCRGDRCNYYIISSSTKIHVGIMTLISGCILYIINKTSFSQI